MATIISNKQYVQYDEHNDVDLNKLYVNIFVGEKPEKQMVPLNNLFIKIDEKNGIAQTRKVESYDDFVKHYKNDNVFSSETAVQSIRYGLSNSVKVQYKQVNVPKRYESISANIAGATEDSEIPYGLKRTLAVRKVLESDNAENIQMLVELDGKQQFIKKDEIYFYNKSNKKIYIKDYKGDLSKISDLVLYNKYGKTIDRIYTGNEFIFSNVVARESIDLDKNEKTIYQITESKNEAGETRTIVDYKHEKMDPYFSEQKYVKKTVDDEVNPGETKEISLVQVKNYEINVFGEYFSVNINNATKMYKLENMFDEEGNQVTNLRSMIGKKILIKEGETIIGVTEPLTIEQATIPYATIKTFQEAEQNVATNNTYLRLKNGEYVKELETVKPIAYKIIGLNNSEYDAYLLKNSDEKGNEKFIVVSKEYFEKHGDTSKYKREDAIRIKRCDVNSKDCAVVQTTSKGEDIEQCTLIKKTKFTTNEIPEDAKDVALEGFKNSYKKGDYKVKDVYRNGKLEKLSELGKRYEYSDVSYHEDYADKLMEFKALKTKDLKIENGKLVGGPKYDVSKGISKGFSAWGNILKSTVGIVILGGIFVPVVGPLVSAVYAVGMAAAIPLIPAINAVRGAVKNRIQADFTDKTKYNRVKHVKDLDKRLKQLYKQMTSKDCVPYSEAKFEDEYSKIYNEIISLSATTIENRLQTINGVGKVTPENASKAKVYMREYKTTERLIKASKKEIAKSKAKFDKLDKKLQRLMAKGKEIDNGFQNKYDEAKGVYDRNKNKGAELENKKQSLMNYNSNETTSQASKGRDKLLSVAKIMKLAVYAKTLNNSEKVKDVIASLDEKEKQLLSTLQLDFDNGLYLDNIPIGVDDTAFVYSKIKQDKHDEWQKITSAEFNSEDGKKYESILKLERTKSGDISTSKSNFKKMLDGSKELIKLTEKENLTEAEHIRIEVLAKDLQGGKELIDYIENKISKNSTTANCPDQENFVCIANNAIKAIEEKNLLEKTEEDIYEYKGEYKDNWLSVKEAIIKMDTSINTSKVPLKEERKSINVYGANPAEEIHTDKAEAKKEQTKDTKSKTEKAYNTKINSEDRLVVMLKANPESKDRKKLIEYIKSSSGVEINDNDILETINRINEKHLQGKDATANAYRCRNKNIDLVLKYGQKYLTIHAKEVKLNKATEHSV